jgi:uncharacterized protein
VTLMAVQAAQVAPQRWRNGGGRTRELLAWPDGADWTLRVSVADIDADGPFSAFAGVQRWFAVIEGAGLMLSWPGGERRMDATSDPIVFDGGAAPDCRLVNGPRRDLNLMLRGGLEGCLQRAASGQAWHEAWPWRACFVAAPARWTGADGTARDLEAGSLLADLPPGSCRLDAISPGTAMFWLGASASPR